MELAIIDPTHSASSMCRTSSSLIEAPGVSVDTHLTKSGKGLSEKFQGVHAAILHSATDTSIGVDPIISSEHALAKKN